MLGFASITVLLLTTVTRSAVANFIMPQSEKCQADFTLECVEILLKQIQNNTATVIPTVVIVHTLEQLMNSTKVLKDAATNQDKLVDYGNALLNATETLVSTLVTKTNTSYYRNITLPSVQAAVFVFGPNASLQELPQLKTTNAYLDIKFSGENKGIDAVLFLSYTNMSSFLKPELFKPSSNTKATMLSTVVTVKLLGTSNQATPIQQFKRAADSVTNVIDVTLEHGATSRSLDTFNTVAMAVGLFFLTLALLTFAVCQRNPKTINTALINLCISLFLAHLLFLLTQKFLIDISINSLACRVMAGVLHFLFLSAFVWMFIEAVLLFIIVKNLTEIRARQEILSWKCLIVIGYVIPLFVVGVSAGLFPAGYGSEQCWLKSDKDFTWSFLAPVCLILGANTLLFIAIGFRMASTLKKLNNETLEIKVTRSDKNLIKSVMLKTLLQFVVIGCPWFLGFFTQNSEVMMVLFLIFNSQQGTFIFFVHCFLNYEIRQQYKKFLYGFCSSRK
ncbi:hypothetical protein NFI96_031401 [Prochilodus magdalenae]|nr:hypothetical protein NFI96_031401 [Prochilodus magdalenae]